MPTLAGIKHFSIHLFPNRTRAFDFSTENGQTESIRNGYQGACSFANIPCTPALLHFQNWKIKYFQ